MPTQQARQPPATIGITQESEQSELKYFDAGVVGVPTVASPTFTLSTAITPGENGVICKDFDWVGCISSLLDNYDTTGIQMGLKARRHCLEHYTGLAVAPKIQSVIFAQE